LLGLTGVNSSNMQSFKQGAATRFAGHSSSVATLAPLQAEQATQEDKRPPNVVILKTPTIARGGMNAGLAPRIINYKLSANSETPIEIAADVINQGSSFEAVPNIERFGPFHQKNILAVIGAGLALGGYQLARKLVFRINDKPLRAIAQKSLPLAVLTGAYRYGLGPALALSLSTAGIGLALWGKELYLLGRNVARFRAYQNPESQQTKRIVAIMNEEVSKRFPDLRQAKDGKPEIILKGHSAGGAEVLAVAKYADKHPDKVAFKVKHVATFGSPLTDKHLSNLPKNVPLTFVRGTRDRVHDFGVACGWLIGLNVCRNPERKLRPGDKYFEVAKNHDQLTQIDNPAISAHIFGQNANNFSQVVIPDSEKALD
jgi:hypothetical protein